MKYLLVFNWYFNDITSNWKYSYMTHSLGDASMTVTYQYEVSRVKEFSFLWKLIAWIILF